MNKWYGHLHTLCIVHDVVLRIDPNRVDLLLQTPDGLVPVGGMAYVDLRAVLSPEVSSAAQYAIVLHEMGHLCHGKPRPGVISTFAVLTTRDAMHCMEEEDHAWDWARAHAMEWTPAMEVAYEYGRETYRQEVVRRVKTDLGLNRAAFKVKDWKP